MSEEQKNPLESEWLGTGRIVTLSDGIFAIAMTLLVLTVKIPHIPADQAAAELPARIRGLWPQLSQYIYAFITLASFWMGHHSQFRYIRRADAAFLWLNILVLMLAALIPFSAEIVGDYGQVPIAAQLFEVNLLLVGLVIYWQWCYALRHELVVPGLARETSKKIRQAALFIPALSLIALAISPFWPDWSTSVYALTPFLHHRGWLARKLRPGS